MPSELPIKYSDDALFSRTLDILDRLVGFDTTSSRSNLELIRYVQHLLSGNGIESRLHWNDDHVMANLVATAGRSAGGDRGVIWSGHTDVVPVDGQSWTSDPFKLRVTDDRAFGRGSADMKGFIACCLAILSTVDQEALTTPITLVLSHEEEIGCVGARRLLGEMRRWPQPRGCVVGEPTEMKVVVGHKGKQNHRIRFTGAPMHAALAPEAANPIVAAAEFAVFAQSLNERFRSTGPHDPRFGIAHSWISIGKVDGGVKPNIVPERCLVEYEIRAIPGHSCDDIADELNRHATGEILTRMRARPATAEISTERLSDTPWFDMDESHPFVREIAPLLGQGEPVERVPFGTEAGLFWGHAGIPTVVCGPGSIGEAHTPNESIALAQLGRCLSRLRSLQLT